MASRLFQFLRECFQKSGIGRETGAFIYALPADETSPVLAAPRHTITALFSCRFKCACPPGWQPHFRSNADRAYNTLHFASKVVCQGASPFGNPKQQNKLNISHFQPCFPAASNVLALPVGNLIFAATPTERITHYTLQAKSCAKGQAPLETPNNKTS